MFDTFVSRHPNTPILLSNSLRIRIRSSDLELSFTFNFITDSSALSSILNSTDSRIYCKPRHLSRHDLDTASAPLWTNPFFDSGTCSRHVRSAARCTRTWCDSIQTELEAWCNALCVKLPAARRSANKARNARPLSDGRSAWPPCA